MARTVSLHIKERNEQIASQAREEIQRTGALDTFAIAQVHGISTQMIRNILKDANVDIPKNKTGPRRKLVSDPITRLHAQIGRDLSEYRFFQAGGKMVSVANELKTNSHRYSQMEAGNYDFTLQDLMRIAELRQTTLAQLVTLRVVNVRGELVEGTVQHSDGSPQED